jgi:hypothetical protein
MNQSFTLPALVHYGERVRHLHTTVAAPCALWIVHTTTRAVCFFVLCNRHWFNRVSGPETVR